MAERLDKLELTQSHLEAAWEIADLALAEVEAKYGTGFPHYNGGQESNLAYHGGYHTEAVPRDALRLAGRLGLLLHERTTARVAGYAHDVVQLKPRGTMEHESADWLVEQMRVRGLPQAMAEAGALAVLATEPIIQEGVLVGQKVGELDYPSRSAERVARTVASADFADLYRPIGPILGHKYWQELNEVEPGSEAPLEGFDDYVRAQIALREGYRFPLRQANRLFATHRKEVMRYEEQVLARLERGEITSWRQLEEQDLAFMRQHS